MTIQELALMMDQGRTPAEMAAKQQYDIRAGNPLWRQRLLATRATPDQELLTKQGLVRDALQQLKTRGRLQEADRTLNFLRGFQSRPNVNLFRAPNDINERALQGMVQEDTNARIAGFDVGYRSDLDNRKRAIENLGIGLKIQDQGLQVGKARQDQWVAMNKLALDQARERRLAKDDALSRQLYLDRLNNAEQSAAYRTADDMVKRGVPLNEVFETVPGLTPVQRRRLQSITQELDRQDAEKYGVLSHTAEMHQNELQRLMDEAEQKAVDQYRRNNSGFFRDEPNLESPEAVAAAEEARREAISDYLNNLRGRDVYYDDASGQFLPLAAQPRARATAPAGGQGLPSPGRLPLMRSAAEAMRLPPGTTFRTPDGRTLIRP